MPLTCRVSSVGARNKAGDHEYLQENINLKQNNKLKRASQAALMVKNPPANASKGRNVGLIPGWGRSPGEGHSNPLQYSCMENPIDKGAWWASVYGVAQSRTQLKRLSSSSSIEIFSNYLWNSFLCKLRGCVCACVLSRLVVSHSLWPHGLWPARLLCPWDSQARIL